MKNLLIYYGWLNSFNSAQNSWNNEKVAQEMAKYNLLVFGDGVATTSHGDYNNSKVIIPRIKTLNPEAIIFGYVSVNQSYANFKTKVDEWFDDDINADGIFFDEAGYDYGTSTTNSREAINAKIDYVHSKGGVCFINAWKVEHIFGANGDASYPDSTWNSNGHDINLTEDDWYLFESFAVTSAGAYEAKVQWKSRSDEVVDKVTCNAAGVCCIDETDQNAQSKFNFGYTAALMSAMDAYGSSDYSSSVSYGASNAKAKMHTRPNFRPIGYDQTCGSNVQVDSADADVYLAYYPKGYCKLDFSISSETSSINDYEA